MIPVRLFITPKLNLGNPKDKEFFETQVITKGSDWTDHYLNIEESKINENIIPVFLFKNITFSEPPFEKSGQVIKEEYQIIHKIKEEVSGEWIFYGHKISNKIIS